MHKIYKEVTIHDKFYSLHKLLNEVTSRARSHSRKKRLVVSSYPSVRQRVPVRLRLDRFPCILTLGSLRKICATNLVKIGQKYRELYTKTKVGLTSWDRRH